MRRKILIVDDNEMNRMVLHRILSDEYVVLEASDGKAALEMMRDTANGLSAVLLDIMMPVMDGFEVLSEMRDDRSLSQIPVIVVTGDSDEGAEIRALALGAKDVVLKPFRPTVVRHRLRNTISLRENAAIVNAITRDSLTGLYNREAFFIRVDEMIARHDAGYYVIVCFDIDNFKVVNDQYGTSKGDDILRQVAETLERGFSKVGGICCRIMADNFSVLYPASFMDTEELAEIRRELSELDGSIQPLSYSIGRYVISDLSLPVSAMYDRAAMAEASIKGRFDVNIAQYDESMRDNLLREQMIINEMNAALEENQFEVWFQPQFNHSSGALIGAEALVRWRHPERGLIYPGEFIPVFERNGFVYELDKYVWDRSCFLLRKWIDEGRSPLPVSVNVSRYDILRIDFFESLTGSVERYGLPAELLRIEITESAFTESPAMIINVVERLIKYGFTIEIDDFGSGYSSLNTLKDVPSHVLKLDMRFLEGSGNNERGGNILESIVRMTKWLGMSVIAEGVEAKSQADFLRSIGCNYVQGYLYARPMPVEEYEALAKGVTKEEKMMVMETVENLDNNAFWDPKSMDTLIFNSYVGGACIFEYCNGELELLRVNEKYAKELGGDSMTMEEALDMDLSETMDRENLAILVANIDKAVETGEESTCEIRFYGFSEDRKFSYLRSTVRVIAKTGDRYLLYCAVANITAQREAEIKEHDTAFRLAMIMENVNGGITAVMLVEGEPEFVFANDRFFTQQGYTREQYFSEVKSSFDVIAPEDRDRVRELIVHANAAHEPVSCVYRIIRRDGSPGWLQSNISNVFLPEIEDAVQLSVTNDITAQVLAEKRESETAERLQIIMENINSGVSAVTISDDAKVEFIFANDIYYEILGYTKEQFVEEVTNAFDLVLPEDMDKTRAVVTKLLETHGSDSYEYRCTKRSGEIVYLRCNASVITMEGVEGKVLLTAISDTTEVNVAKQKVQTAFDQVDAILQNVNGGISAATIHDGRIEYLFANDRFYSNVGYTREQFETELPGGIFDIIHPEDLPLVISTPEQGGESSSASIEFRAYKRDGSVAWMRSNGSNCRISGIEQPVHIAVTNDITEEKLAEQRIKRSAEQLQFLNDTARDLLGEGDAEKGIENVLRKALEYFSASRAFIYEYRVESNLCVMTYEACAEGVEPINSDNRSFALDDARNWLDTFRSQKFILHKRNGEYGEMWEEEDSIMEAIGVQSTLACSLRDGSWTIGAIGVHDPSSHIENIDNLEAVSEYISAIILRRDLNAKILSDNENMRALMNDTPGGFTRSRMNPDGSVDLQYVNDNYCKLRKLTREEIIERERAAPMSGIHPDDLDKVRQAARSLLNTGKTRGVSFRLMCGDEYAWVMVYGRMTHDETGGVYINTYYADLSEQDKEFISFREMLPAVLSTIFAAADDLSFVKDAELRYICCSNPFANMVGLEIAEDVAGKTDYDLFEKNLAEQYRGDDFKLMESGRSLVNYVESIPSVDGKARYSVTSKYLLRDASGGVVGLYGTGRVVPESMLTEEQLRNAKRENGE